jgi:hypothetical protein
MSNRLKPQAARLRLAGIAICGCLVALEPSACLAAGDGEETGRVNSGELVEVSGVAASRVNPDVLWVHNDGPSRRIFALSATGELVATVTHDVAVSDVEDIAIGPGPIPGQDYLYLGDIGDNDERRRDVRIIRIPEPRVNGEPGQQLPAEEAEVFRLVYPDGAHDAETLLVDPLTGELVVVTKERRSSRLYRAALSLPEPEKTFRLQATGKLNLDQVSAGAVSYDGKRVILRRENRGWMWDRAAGESIAAALTRQPTSVAVLGERQNDNGEAVSFDASGQHYFTISEGKKQAIYRFDVLETAVE